MAYWQSNKLEPASSRELIFRRRLFAPLLVDLALCLQPIIELGARSKPALARNLVRSISDTPFALLWRLDRR